MSIPPRQESQATGDPSIAAQIKSLRASVAAHPTLAALNDLGNALLAANQLDEAESVLQRAIQIDPKFVLAHCNLGLVYRARTRFADAARSFSRATELQPDLFGAHFLKGAALAESGDIASAQQAWDRALSLQSTPPVQYEIGALLQRLGHVDEALPYLRRAVEMDSQNASLYLRLAGALVDANQLAEAESIGRRAVKLAPRLAETHLNLGVALHLRNDLAAAANSYREAIRLNPALARAQINLADALSQLGDDSAAMQSFERGAALGPLDFRAHQILTTMLLRANRPRDAIAAATNAVELAPTSAESAANLAVAQYEAGERQAAIPTFERAVALSPTNDAVHRNLSLALLSLGQFERGWREYEHRPKPAVPETMREWDGSPLDGRRILLVGEQGFGDTIQFIRYAPLVAARGGKITVIAPQPLRRLIEKVRGVDEVIVNLSDLRDCEVHAHLLSLPRMFGMKSDADIPAEVPYLFPDETRQESLRDALATSGLRVGLVWAGNPKYLNDRRRSVPVDWIEPIVTQPGIRCYSLLVGPAAQRDATAVKRMNITPLTEWLSDFAETASAISQMDLIITVDTAVAHLAGALGRPVWTMLPAAADWRWQNDREDSPWYPTMRLFRQREFGNWRDVIDRIAEALAQRIASSQNPQT